MSTRTAATRYAKALLDVAATDAAAPRSSATSPPSSRPCTRTASCSRR